MIYRDVQIGKALLRTYVLSNYEGLDPDKLLITADDQVYTSGYETSEILTDLCMNLFSRGKYTDRTLKYLAKHFDGALEEMVKIWDQAQRGDAGCEKLEERILLYSMFTHTLPDQAEDVLEDYSVGGANAAVLRAFLSFLGEYYLLENREITEESAERFSRQCNLKDDHMRIIVLSWLKYLSTQEEVPQKEL
ncbi:MAG: hypothetical protein J5891_02005, partial [Spirochaetales bacterium]|nr:hypothetical protein [Spirochaetales bacterium]